MCGIAGIVAPHVARNADALARMVFSLRHRGPDGSGIHLFPDCALGHSRLSIVDPEGGRQPMLSPDERTGITFNGEIYGYREMRRALADHPFRTNSDTELILALYDRHGIEMTSRLPGMFAFALWDDGRKRLFCARDRFGEKPFYYAFGQDGELIFASEIKAVLAGGMVEPSLHRGSLVHYFRRGYVHPTQTIYANVHVLPPAHALVYEEGRLRTWRYWDMPPSRDRIDLSEAVDRFRSLFDQAVQRQLIADVPVGAFLSGGLDSSSVVAAASRSRSGLRTLSFGFDGAHDELPFAREVARAYGTEHIELRADSARLGDLLQEMQGVYDEPFADSSNVPTYLLCREARKELKVVLTGDGGDELLGGYSWYRPLLWGDAGRNASNGTYAAARLILAFLERAHVRRLGWLQDRARGIVGGRRYGSIGEYHRMEGRFFHDWELESLGFSVEDLTAGLEPPHFNGSVEGAQRMDLVDYMPGDILVKIDRASMAHGLELRAPFLDVEFAEFCLSLPSRLKIRPGQDKVVLRAAYARDWPASIRTRSKQGFGAPVRNWLDRPAIASLVHDRFGGPAGPLDELIDPSGARAVIAEKGHRSWILLTLALWFETRGVPGAGLEKTPAARSIPPRPAPPQASGARAR